MLTLLDNWEYRIEEHGDAQLPVKLERKLRSGRAVELETLGWFDCYEHAIDAMAAHAEGSGAVALDEMRRGVDADLDATAKELLGRMDWESFTLRGDSAGASTSKQTARAQLPLTF